METLLNALKAAAEPTRLRLLVLCGHAELSVSELTQILGQSQPRVSRHLKLLSEAGLLERSREGTWSYFRLAADSEVADVARTLIDAVDGDDPVIALDLERLETVRRHRAETAAAYFRETAGRWHEIRALHVPEKDVEATLLDLVPARCDALLDIGTGTGRMLELFAERTENALGVDMSREMLAVARANLERDGLRHCRVRQADMYQLPLQAASFDVAIIHQVLHYAELPADVLAEAARVLRPGGSLIVVDLDRHDLESLRIDHAHIRLGIDSAELAGWAARAGLAIDTVRRLEGDPLTVMVWRLTRRGDGAATDTATWQPADEA